ncbi:hypothetical protein D7V86_22280 [bacterium D16-51]|nr:hypothetical protein D7V96_14185 [bacterium D16-59]RKI55131.1 hypothetical protein D7V86_22280 [bacterium D16-51]
MLYQTYKLGKMKKSPVRRFYTREELESYELPRLREICRAEHIKPSTVDTYSDKKKLTELLYRYLGIAKKDRISAWSEEGGRLLEEAFRENGTEKEAEIDLPARMEIYQGQNSLADPPYFITGKMEETGQYVFLEDSKGKIQAALTAEPAGSCKYRLFLSGERMSGKIPSGRFYGWNLLFTGADSSEEAVRRYLGRGKKRKKLSYARCPLPEVLVKEASVSEEPLIIDFGTSFTAAGTCSEIDGPQRISFLDAADSGRLEEEGRPCSLCPSVIAVADCSGQSEEDICFLYGNEAVLASKRQGFLAGNSIFYDMKRWAGRYREHIFVTDLEGNACGTERIYLIRKFLLYVIRQAEWRTRKHYTKLCFICPVKQKGLFLRMYCEALPEYQILSEDEADEAVAAVYHFLERSIREESYEEGVLKRALILDCGGGTSNLVSCDYKITEEGITKRLDLHVAFAHGDTNFGGNHLTWRVLQFLKIRLAEQIAQTPPVPLDNLFPGILSDVYGRVDEEGTEKAYLTFTEAYQEAEAVIPTCFSLYRNQEETKYLKARCNYYFLWNLAEAVKEKLFCKTGVCRLPLRSLFADYSERPVFDDFHLSVQAKGGILETDTLCPELVIEKEEVTLLWKPDIYGFVKNFIEPWYENGSLMEVERIVLSGQSSKIELFRDVLKEYIAGRKARGAKEDSSIRKLMCIDGAMAYRQDKKTGRIRSVLSYEPAKVPYSLTAQDYASGGREKRLLEKGSLMGQVYGRISRPVEAEEVLFRLKDGTGKEVCRIPFFFQKEDYSETGYDEICAGYPILRQEDLDSIENGELRIFVFADDENWGVSILEIARKDNVLYSCPLSFIPFEAGAWETDFFDGRH